MSRWSPLNWPVLRQVRTGDVLGRGPSVTSPTTRSVAPRTVTADRVVPERVPVLRGGLRAAGVRQGRQGRADRGRSGFADLARAAVPQGLGQRAARQLSAPRRPRCSTARPTPPSGSASTPTPRSTWWPTGSSKPAGTPGRTSTSRAARCAARWGSPPGRRHAGQRRELPHQEALHRGRRHPDREPGPHLTLRHGSQSGNLVRARRRHPDPAGHGQRRLHRHPGLQHGRVPSGRLPVGGGGPGPGREGHPRRSAVHPHLGGRRQAHPDPGRLRRGAARRADQPRAHQRAVVQGVRARLHQRGHPGERGLPRTPRTSAGCSPASTPRPVTTTRRPGPTQDDEERHDGRRRARRQRLGPRGRRRARQRRPAAAARPRAARRDPAAPATVFQILKRHYARYTPEMVREVVRHQPSRTSTTWPAPSPRTPGANAPPASPTPSAGPSTRWARSSSAPPRSCSCCWATSGAPAAASWRCAGTPASRARPTSRRCSTCCPATCRCLWPAYTTPSPDYLDAVASEEAEGLLGPRRRLRRQPAQGVVGRRRPRRQRLGLRLPAPARPARTARTRRSPRCSTTRSRATSCSARTRPSGRRTAGCSAWPCRT